MKQSLDVEVRSMLAARRGSWLAIAERSGVSHSWISKFVNDKIPNPGYATLSKLRELLANKAAKGAKSAGALGKDA